MVISTKPPSEPVLRIVFESAGGRKDGTIGTEAALYCSSQPPMFVCMCPQALLRHLRSDTSARDMLGLPSTFRAGVQKHDALLHTMELYAPKATLPNCMISTSAPPHP